ncbi:MAG: serine hydrolase, partial [Bacteroidales bacterium]|nr:serine hydrolase [Bacteroidales bacterium]
PPPPPPAMDTVELLPFKHLIHAGIDGLMVGHLSVPALEKDVLLPSSQSRAITGALLHDSLGFKGLCFTDALVMKGTVSSYSGMNCIRSLQASNDILLSPANLPADITAVVKAVEKGLLSDSLIDAKCRKLLTYKYALGLSKQQPIQLDSIVDVLNHEQAKALNLRLHVEAITLLRNQNDFLPLRHLDSKKTAVVLLGASDKDNAFVQQLKAYQENIDVYPVLAGNENDREDLAEQLKTYDRCIVAIHANTRQQQLWLARLRHLPHLALCFFSSPYSMALHGDILQEAEAVLCAYENSELSQKAVAQAIFGGNSISGRLSAPIGKYYPCGWGLDTEKTRLSYLYPENVDMSSLRMMAIDSIVEDALQREVFPGCQVLVAKDGAVVWNKSYGYIDHEHSRAVSNDDIYDLASLTKAIACTPMIMSLAEQGRLHLDEAVSNYLPALKEGDKSDLSFRQMLYHESRLPSFVPFYQMLIDTSSYASPFFLTYRADSVHCMRFDENAWAPGSYNFYPHLVSSTAKDSFSLQVAEDFYVHDSFRDSVIRRISDADLLKRKRYVYSDLGYLLMGFAAENIARKTVEDYVFDEFYAPLGAYTTSYHPLKRFDASRIVPTTLDTCLRKQLLCGYTHDEAAAFWAVLRAMPAFFPMPTIWLRFCRCISNKALMAAIVILRLRPCASLLQPAAN